MKKILILVVAYLSVSVACRAIVPIMGTLGACVGATASLEDTTIGGVWSSSNTAVATIGSVGHFGADINGISTGTATITYTVGGSYVTALFTVGGTIPAPITGTTSMCVGGTSSLSDATPGGTWSTTGYFTTVGPTTGIVNGFSAGTDIIYYSTGSFCNVSTHVSVLTAPIVYLEGPSTVCAGFTVTETDSAAGSGIWSSASTAIATVGSTGIVTGVSAGITTISYTVTTACGTTTGTRTISVSSTTSAGTITGPSSLYAGASIPLSDGVSGGAWSSSNTLVATVDATTGIVTGVAVGVATINYTVIGCGGSAFTSAGVTVTPFNGISGHVLFSGWRHLDSIKVWLITYNPGTFDLEAVDSTIVVGVGTSLYYQFLSEPSDSFRIKASISTDSVGLYGIGFIPTYHASSYYWDSATVLYHTAGVGDINQDINMLFGTYVPGPGFIAGNVLLGANKGTASSIPSVGLKMYCIDGSGKVIQQTTTDASGNYQFSGVPLGTYSIFPEALNYLTTAYTSVSLTLAKPSMTTATFVQHTLSHTITPTGTTGVNAANFATASVIAYPNPTTGNLNIQWQEPTAEKAVLTISEITGREIYKSSIDMNKGSGANQIDLSSLNNGLYMISIKSAAINYNSKLQVQK